MNSKDRDRALARERMRVLRSANSGRTISDQAREDALRRLVDRHRDEYDLLRSETFYRLIGRGWR